MRLRLLSLLIWCVAAISLQADMPEIGPLAKYVAKADTSFGWKKVRSGQVSGVDYAELILTSQTWRNIEWKHQLFILRPPGMPADARHGMLFIGGGSWKPELDQASSDPVKMPRESALFAALASQLQAPVAILLHVPHQPIFDGKVEDQIIAYTFDEFMKTQDPEWPLLLPMVKSAVRGMDAVQQFVDQEWNVKLDSFTVTGGSKRGWTTWLTGAVDRRAVGLAPMVIDVLNMAAQMRHHRETWGAPSDEIQDYTERGLTERLESPQAASLRAIVDPFSYRQTLSQPKLIILGTNDRYWPLDSLSLYWDGLVGQKYIMYVPNNGHGLKDVGRLSGSLAALHQHVAHGQPLPKLDWKFVEGQDKLVLQVQADIQPIQVDTWTASAPTLDFRGAQWSSRPSRKEANGFVCELPKPASGYAAMFGELVFNGRSLPYFLSTNVKIISSTRAAAE